MNKAINDYLEHNDDLLPDSVFGNGHRCSVHLTDGTYLPCVMLRESNGVVELALRRFEQEKAGAGIFRTANAYESIVKHFVISGNRVNYYDIVKVEPSRYAIPMNLSKQIHGETTMAWTGFVLEMQDKKLVPFGTTFSMEFFNLPDAYSFGDVVAVHNHSYVSPNGELKPLKQGMVQPPSDYNRSLVYRERPYFVCYYDLKQKDA